MNSADRAVGRSSRIRRMNQSAILQLVYASQPIARTDVARILGLSQSTVNRLVEQLVQEGLLLEGGVRSRGSKGGRPARLIHFNANAGRIAVVDLSAVPWRAALVNLTGEIVQSFTAQPVFGDAGA